MTCDLVMESCWTSQRLRKWSTFAYGRSQRPSSKSWLPVWSLKAETSALVPDDVDFEDERWQSIAETGHIKGFSLLNVDVSIIRAVQ